jgi:peptide deformylase
MLRHLPRVPDRVGNVRYPTRQVELIIPDHSEQRKGACRAEMADLEILTYPAPILQREAQAVPRISPRVQRLARDMLDTMCTASGIGLAAPQVGVRKRVIVVDVREDPRVLVNPKIAATEGEQVGLEGCLSLPDLVGEVRRAEWMMVNGLDRRGRPVSLEGEGLLARVLQHEIDHLDGILFVARVEDPTRLWRVSELSTAAEKEVARI